MVTTGGAIGREGAMILLAAPPASLFARRFTPKQNGSCGSPVQGRRRDGQRLSRTLAGSLFIAEILFGTLMLASLGPVVISAVIALLVTQLINGGASPLYRWSFAETLTALHYALMLATGLLAGLCGPLFIAMMSYSHCCFTHGLTAVAAGARRNDCRPAVRWSRLRCG